MSSSIKQAIIKPKLGYHVTEKEKEKNVFDSHSETEQIVWHRCPSMQVSLYHHQLTEQFVAHECTVLVL